MMLMLISVCAAAKRSTRQSSGDSDASIWFASALVPLVVIAMFAVASLF